MAGIFYNFLASFSDMGLSEAIIREKQGKAFLQSAHSIFLITGLITSILLALLSYPISIFFSNSKLLPVLLTYSLVLFLYSIPKAMIASVRKDNHLVVVARGELLAVAFQVACSIVLAYFGFSIWSLVIPNLIIPFIYAFYYKKHVNLRLLHISVIEIRQTWSLTKSMIHSFGILNFIQYWERTAPNLLVGKFFGETQLGLYSRGYSLMDLPRKLFLEQVNIILLPGLAARNLTHDELKKEMTRLIKLMSSLITFPSLLLILYPHKISTLLWGNNWTSVGNIIGILGCILLVSGLDQLSTNLFILTRKERVMFYKGIIYGISSIMLVLIGSFFSIEVVAYLYTGGVLLIGFPSTLYLGYYRSFGFTISEILNMAFYHYAAAMSIFLFKATGLDSLIIYPAFAIALISMISVFDYFRKIKDQSA